MASFAEEQPKKKGLLKRGDDGANPNAASEFSQTLGKDGSIALSAEEMALNGAPQGELFMANVVSREEISPPEGNGEDIVENLLEDLKAKKSFAWHESFKACDSLRSVIIHAPGDNSIDAKTVKMFMPALVKWGGNSRSVLAHNAIVTIADLLHFLPGAVASAGVDTVAAATNLFLDTSKKNKAGVLKARVKTVLGEVANSSASPSDAATELLIAMLVPALGVKTWVTHLDLQVMNQTFAFAEASVDRFCELDDALAALLARPVAVVALLQGLGLGVISKSADAKSGAKRCVRKLHGALLRGGGGGWDDDTAGGGGGVVDFAALVKQYKDTLSSKCVSDLLGVPLPSSSSDAAQARAAADDLSIPEPAFFKQTSKRGFTAPPPAADSTGKEPRSSTSVKERGTGESTAAASGSSSSRTTRSARESGDEIWRQLAAYLKQIKGRPQELFQRFDTDRSRNIDKKEFLTGLRNVGVDVAEIAASGGDGAEARTIALAVKDAFKVGGVQHKTITLADMKSLLVNASKQLTDDDLAAAKARKDASTRGARTSRQRAASKPSKPSKQPAPSTSVSALKKKVATPSSARAASTPAGRPTPSSKSKASATMAKKPAGRAVRNTMDDLESLMESSTLNADDDEDFNDDGITLTPAVSSKPRRRMSALGVTLAGIDAIAALDAEEEVAATKKKGPNAGSSSSLSSSSNAKKKRSGVALAFEKAALTAAEKLRDELEGHSATVLPVEGGDDTAKTRAALDEASMLVVLMTANYGSEKKHAVEIEAVVQGTLPTLIVDLDNPYNRGDDRTPRLFALLAEKGIDMKGDEAAPTLATPSIGFFENEKAALTKVPDDLATKVMNKLIIVAQTTASYNVDLNQKVTAVSNAKARRASLIDWDSLGTDNDDDEEGNDESDKAAESAQEEQMMKMYEERQALEKAGKKR